MKTDLLSLDPSDILSDMPAHFDLLDAKRVIEAEKADRLDYPNPARPQDLLSRTRWAENAGIPGRPDGQTAAGGGADPRQVLFLILSINTNRRPA